MVGNIGGAYQLISNLLHKRAIPLWKENGSEREMTVEEIAEAVDEVQKLIPTFSYNTFQARVTNDAELVSVYKGATNNYEKLQIYRIINMDKKLHENDIVSKFIKESFHIENEYLMQLNPAKYPTTPNFIIEQCDKKIAEIIT